MKSRHEYMTAEQKAKWAYAERQAGRKLPRTHENCMKIFGSYTKRVVDGELKKVLIPGPARPGKTAKDRQKGR